MRKEGLTFQISFILSFDLRKLKPNANFYVLSKKCPVKLNFLSLVLRFIYLKTDLFSHLRLCLAENKRSDEVGQIGIGHCYGLLVRETSVSVRSPVLCQHGRGHRGQSCITLDVCFTRTTTVFIKAVNWLSVTSLSQATVDPIKQHHSVTMWAQNIN